MRIGIDVGGTKIEGIALEHADVLVRRRIAAPRGDYDATIIAVRDLVAAIQKETGLTGTIGIGIPGAISAINQQFVFHEFRDRHRKIASSVRKPKDGIDQTLVG